MLTAEIKVNGCLIGHLYIVNRGPVGVEPEMYSYSYEAYSLPDKGEKKGLIKTGRVIHYAPDGAWALVKKCIELFTK